MTSLASNLSLEDLLLPTIEGFFNPESVAVVGASTNTASLGHTVAVQMKRSFKGKVYFVNPKGGELLGEPLYKSAAAIPDPVDFAVIVVAAKFVPAIMREIVAKECKACHIPGGGFAEFDEQGQDLQAQVMAIAHAGGVRVLGPNCLGAYFPSVGVDTFFVPSELLPRGKEGDITLLSQSGGFAVGWYSEANKRLGTIDRFRSLVSFGNGVDISEADLYSQAVRDKGTKQVWMYLEGVKHGRRFLNLLRKATPFLPTIVMTGGSTSDGARAALSHSSSLAPDSRVFKGLLKWAGVFVAEKWADVINTSQGYSNCPPTKGGRVAVVSNCGGMSVVCVDKLASQHGLKLAVFDDALLEKAKKFFKPPAVVSNPVDMTGSGSMDDYLHMLRLLNDSEAIDIILWNLATFVPTLGGDDNICNTLIDEFAPNGSNPAKKPMIGWLYGARNNSVMDACNKAGLTVLVDENEAAVLAHTLYERSQYLINAKESESVNMSHEITALRRNKTIINTLRDTQSESRRSLMEHEAMTVFHEADIPTPKFCVAKSLDQVEHAYTTSFGDGTVIVMKVISPEILHKSDVGGVLLNLSNKDAVFKAASQLFSMFTNDDMRGVLMCEMVGKGFEMIVGTHLDAVFGPVVLCGIGGVLVEVINDVVFGPCPLPLPDSKRLIRSLEHRKLLDEGIRGSGPAGIDAIEQVVHKMSILAAAYPDFIDSIDANPVISSPDSTVAVDARVILKSSLPGPTVSPASSPRLRTPIFVPQKKLKCPEFKLE